MSMSIFRSIILLLKRRRLAKKFKIKFTRASKWRMPKKIFINKKWIDLNLINDHSTNTAFVDIFLDDCYGLSFFQKKLKSVSNVLDIGANQGLFTVAAHSFFSQATIHAYEPNPEIIPYLSFQAKSPKAACFNEAVGLNNGFIRLELEKDSLHTRTVHDTNGVIPQVALKECIERLGGGLDLLKLDCEGAEWEILEDIETLKTIKAITLEYHLNNLKTHNKIIEVLENANFNCLKHSVDGPTWGIVWALNNYHQ